MLLRSLIIILTPFLLYVSKSLATEAPELEALQKRLLLLEKEILDLKMKNVVEDKFEWQFLKMTEIENDIKKLHNRFEILENNYYKELKNLKALIVNSHTSNVEKVEDLGNYKLITAKLGDFTIKSKVTRDTEIPSSKVKLHIPADRCCVYEDNKLI